MDGLMDVCMYVCKYIYLHSERHSHTHTHSAERFPARGFWRQDYARGRNAGGKGRGGLTVWTIWAMSLKACSRLSRHTLIMWVSSTTTGWFAASISLIIGAVMGPETAPSSCAVARSGGAWREVVGFRWPCDPNMRPHYGARQCRPAAGWGRSWRARKLRTIGCWLSHSVCAESDERSPGSPGASQSSATPCCPSSCSGASPSAAMPSRGAGARAERRAPAAAPGRARACGGASVLARGASSAETGARRGGPAERKEGFMRAEKNV